MTTPVIEMRSAAFGYAESVVVSDVTLDVAPGEVVAILGPNGSGKSTLIRGLLGLGSQLSGDVQLFGMPRADFRDFTRLGYVPQRHTLATSVRATVQEIVAIGRLPHQRWWAPWAARSKEDNRIIAGALDVVGLADRATTDVTTLSGGQQRRVLIARALAAQPDVLIMDEPTAGVDAASQQVLADVLARLAARGTTMLIVTHELDALADVVSRVVVVQDGHVAFDGSPAQFASRTADLAMASTRQDQHHHHEHDDLASGGRGVPGVRARSPLDAERRHRHG